MEVLGGPEAQKHQAQPLYASSNVRTVPPVEPGTVSAAYPVTCCTELADFRMLWEALIVSVSSLLDCAAKGTSGCKCISAS